ncbi:MAG: glutathione S-transferase N-terminal domain-containing protein [Bdellovibrionota bacterium]
MNASTRSAKVNPTVTAPQIELFQNENSAFCHAVRAKLSALDLDFIAHNVHENPLKHEQLVLAGGKDQIPFLIDHKTGTKLYDSAPIVAYLDSHYGAGHLAEGRILKLAHRLQSGLEARKSAIAWSVKAPIEKIRVVGSDVRGAWQTIRGSLRMMREMVASTRAG